LLSPFSVASVAYAATQKEPSTSPSSFAYEVMFWPAFFTKEEVVEERSAEADASLSSVRTIPCALVIKV
jgi:hypothetical protein